MNFLMNRFGLKKTTTVVATTVVAATLMYQAYNAYKVYRARKARKAFQQPHVETDPPFEAKYFKEYDELEDDPDTPVPPMNAHVRETTPQGDVIMTYDADRVVFCYYCDTRSVQFKYLESVARKYVVTHGCKRIYIDFREELSKAKTKAAAAAAANAVATTKTTAKTTAKSTSSVFAQLKKYSMTSVPIINNSNKLLNANNANAKNAKNATANDERACVLKEQVTRYLYCGRLDDFIVVSEGSHATETHDFNIIKPIDYASYKKMNDA